MGENEVLIGLQAIHPDLADVDFNVFTYLWVISGQFFFPFFSLGCSKLI